MNFTLAKHLPESCIVDIKALQVLDSRGTPTVRVEVLLGNGTVAEAYVPSGASTGKFEACELRDGDASYYFSKSVRKAVENVAKVKGELEGLNVLESRKIDELLLQIDGTSNKSKLGANAILGISLAVHKAAANYLGLPLYSYLGGAQARTLPTPLVNVINGGAHAANSVDFQEFMLVPLKNDSFADNIRMCSEIFQKLKGIIKKRGLSTGVGDEGGFAPDLKNAEEALALLCEASESAGYSMGSDMAIALDVAASEFYDASAKKYILKKSSKEELSAEQLVELYANFVKNYHVVSIEDGLDEEDWDGWKHLTESLGSKVQLVGDDLFVTNTERLQRGIDNQVGNAILIKLNQIGTVSETLDAIRLAQNNQYGVVISHRSGETEDSFMSDLALAVNAGQIKTGSVCRGERTAKYNRLLVIEDEIRGGVLYNGFRKK